MQRAGQVVSGSFVFMVFSLRFDMLQLTSTDAGIVTCGFHQHPERTEIGMKTIIAIIIVVIAIPVCIFFYRNALDRSKSNKTSLWGSFNHEYGSEDNLGKMTPSALEGLEEASRRSKKKETTADWRDK